MRSRHSVEEKFETVMEALTENTTQAEICRRHGMFPTQLAKWKEQFIESGKKGLSDGRHPHSSEEEIDDLKRMKGEQTTENYHIRLKPKTAKLLIEKIKDNFNKRYQFKNKQYTLDNILYENVRTLSNYISGKSKEFDFNIPEIRIERVDSKDVRSKIMEIDPIKRKELKINKSTLWYKQKKIKEGKEIKVYKRTRVNIE